MDIDIVPENIARRIGNAEYRTRDRKDIAAIFTQDRQKSTYNPDVELYVRESELTRDKKELLGDIEKLCSEIIAEFEEQMEALMEIHMSGDNAFTPSIREKMRDRGYTVPKMAIYDYEQGVAMLEKLPGIDPSKLKEGDFLILFQLPKPISRFWYRGGLGQWGDGAKEIPEDNIEWGYFYRKSVKAMWEKRAEYEGPGKLAFARINEASQHDPRRYYYLWSVSRDTSKEAKKARQDDDRDDDYRDDRY